MAEERLLLGGIERIYVSSSIANFRDKLIAQTGRNLWRKRDFLRPTVFFGLYHHKDWIRFILHRGRKKVFWCGGDILNLEGNEYGSSFWRWVLPRVNAVHLCENEVEQSRLKRFGFCGIIKPILFDGNFTYGISRPLKKPHVFMCVHKGREEEYGLLMVLDLAKILRKITFHVYGDSEIKKGQDSVVFHGKVSSKQFDKEIRKYQAGIRFNEFDGFGEVLVKSILLGQYPISTIQYPMIDCARTLHEYAILLDELTRKTRPNYEGRRFWLQRFHSNLLEVLS